jgi:Tfp pilus assembly protein PilN
MRAVNLLPRDVAKPKTRQVNVPLVTGIVVGFLVVTVLTVGFVRESSKVSHKRTELDAARAELAQIPAPALPEPGSSTLALDRANRIVALQGALNGRVAWDRVLREISLVVPDDVWLSGLSLSAPTPATLLPPTSSDQSQTPAPSTSTSTASGFTMSGQSFTHQGVARLLSRLSLVPDLENVTLGHSTKVKTTGTRPAVEFTVNAGIRAPGATQ